MTRSALVTLPVLRCFFHLNLAANRLVASATQRKRRASILQSLMQKHSPSEVASRKYFSFGPSSNLNENKSFKG